MIEDFSRRRGHPWRAPVHASKVAARQKAVQVIEKMGGLRLANARPCDVLARRFSDNVPNGSFC
jgi:hypothetical protein